MAHVRVTIFFKYISCFTCFCVAPYICHCYISPSVFKLFLFQYLAHIVNITHTTQIYRKLQNNLCVCRSFLYALYYLFLHGKAPAVSGHCAPLFKSSLDRRFAFLVVLPFAGLCDIIAILLVRSFYPVNMGCGKVLLNLGKANTAGEDNKYMCVVCIFIQSALVTHTVVYNRREFA
jgi:hypothetical protein